MFWKTWKVRVLWQHGKVRKFCEQQVGSTTSAVTIWEQAKNFQSLTFLIPIPRRGDSVYSVGKFSAIRGEKIQSEDFDQKSGESQWKVIGLENEKMMKALTQKECPFLGAKSKVMHEKFFWVKVVCSVLQWRKTGAFHKNNLFEKKCFETINEAGFFFFCFF